MENTPGGYSTGKSGDQKNFKTAAWVAYGVGAACVATGAILFGVGAASRGGSSTEVALVPAIAPGQAGAVLSGRF